MLSHLVHCICTFLMSVPHCCLCKLTWFPWVALLRLCALQTVCFEELMFSDTSATLPALQPGSSSCLGQARDSGHRAEQSRETPACLAPTQNTTHLSVQCGLSCEALVHNLCQVYVNLLRSFWKSEWLLGYVKCFFCID